MQRGPGSAVSNHVAAPRSAPSLTRASETLRTVNLDYKVLFDTTTSNSSTFYKIIVLTFPSIVDGLRVIGKQGL